MIGLHLCLSAEEIELELRRSIGAEISAAELQRTIVLNAKSLIEKDADFAKFAARILLSYIYEEVLDWSIQRDGVPSLKAAHQKQFKRYLRHGVEIKRISPELLERYDLDRLANAFDPSADLDLDYLGIQTLYDRYLIVDKTGNGTPRRVETPQFFWMRVSMGLFKAEEHNREDWVIRLYQLYKGRRFCSSTPTLFNSGTLHSQLSSCYLYKVDDSIESIMIRGISENAFLSKWAGGARGIVDERAGNGSLHPGYERREPGSHSLPEVAQRPTGGGEPRWQASGVRVCVSGDLAQRYRGFPRVACEHRGRASTHARHEHGELDSGSFHEADGGASALDSDACQRVPGSSRSIREGLRAALPRIRSVGR